ncbi:MAG: DUF6261 family protein [Tannerellaceae bacterium]|nr:DUF6261 family protein [Tannerellaceae bacterium]
MKTINKFKHLIWIFRNGDHFEFFDEIIRFMTGHAASLGDALKLWTAFVAVFQKEDDIYKRSLKSSETAGINKANESRINQFRLIKGAVELSLLSQESARRQAATALAFVTDNFKHIPTAPMNQASALITNMVQDFRRPQYAAHAETLGLQVEINFLEQFNNSFKALFEEREQSMGSAMQEGNMKYIRPFVDKAFADFAEAIGSLYAVAKLGGKTAEMETFGAIIDHINHVIYSYNKMYARISGSSSKNKPGNGDEDTPGGEDTPGDEDIPGGEDTPGGGEDTPGDGIPVLQVASQELFSDNMGMTVTASNPAAFAAALYPGAQGGLLRLRTDATDVEPAEPDFHIDSFLMGSGGETPGGLKASVPDGYFFLSSPETNPCEAWVEKDGVVLARFTGMIYDGLNGMD